ncbi:hypothetical protein BJ875DRAFT_184000 [Amylocarpus encephaloides]|uniref:Uncharacterized protein n=1 Tax=Amylocarpus encephaloides TaxID=45428 RepID=A0A9P8C9E1_9HELO|nr:hypothetical protein BJ875DRAFT_184000 [Amylocarpus encephaloides]
MFLLMVVWLYHAQRSSRPYEVSQDNLPTTISPPHALAQPFSTFEVQVSSNEHRLSTISTNPPSSRKSTRPVPELRYAIFRHLGEVGRESASVMRVNASYYRHRGGPSGSNLRTGCRVVEFWLGEIVQRPLGHTVQRLQLQARELVLHHHTHLSHLESNRQDAQVLNPDLAIRAFLPRFFVCKLRTILP